MTTTDQIAMNNSATNENLTANQQLAAQIVATETPCQPTMTIIKTADDTVKFCDGKFHSVFSQKYFAAIVQAPNDILSYCIFSGGDTEVYNVSEHEVSYEKFFEVLTERGAFLSPVKFEVGKVYRLNSHVRKCNLKAIKRGSTYLTFKELNNHGQVTGAEERYKIKSNGGSEFIAVNTISSLTATLYATNLVTDFAPVVAVTPAVTNEAHDTIASANSNAKKSRKAYTGKAYTVYTEDEWTKSTEGEDIPIKFNHINIVLHNNGAIAIDGQFNCNRIETAYNRFCKIMASIDPADYPQLAGWFFPSAKKIICTTNEYGYTYWVNENDDFLFCADPRESLAVDINEDTFYFYGNFDLPKQTTAADVINTEAQDAETEIANNSADETVNAESAPVDDFESKLAKLKADVDAARIDYDAKTAELERLQDAVENAKAEESIAWSKYFRLKDTLSEFARAKAKELCDTLIDDTILKAGKCQFITDSGSRVEEFCSQIAITFFNGKFRIAGWQNKLAHYDTPAQVTAAINQLKAAIIRGDKEFKFPTIEQLKLLHAKDAFRKLYRYNELYHIIASNGQHMWYSFSQRISSKARDSILKEYGITVDEFLAAEKIVEVEWEVEYEAKAKIHDQAKFLWDKIQRESKPLDDDNVADLLPSVDVLNDVQIDAPTEPYKPQCTWEDPHDYDEPGNLNFDPNDRLRAYGNYTVDSVTLAMETALLRCQAACHALDIPAALNELKLFATCHCVDNSEPKKEFTPTPKRDRQTGDAASYEQIEAKAIKYDDTVKDLDKQIETIEDECAFNQVCYDEPDDSRERIHFDAELKQLIDRGLKLIKKRDTLKIHRDRLYLTIEKLDAQAI